MRYAWIAVRLTLLVLIAVSPLLTPAPPQAQAFKLDGYGGHPEITRRALERVSALIETNLLTFSEPAIEDIISQNEDVDWISLGGTGPTTAAWHFDDEELSAGTWRIFEKRQEILKELRQEVPDGEDAREALGEALHGIQDFYAHSNWADLRVRSASAARTVRFGFEILSAPASQHQMCELDDPSTLAAFGLSELTSGYFGWTPEGKCRHGMFSPGIAKDVDPDLPPSSYTDVQRAAVEEAEAASRRFVQDIVDRLQRDGNVEGIRALMQISGKLVFVIDVSGSMGDEIAQIKAQVRRKIEDSIRADRPPEDYVLVTFSDPNSEQTVFATSDPQSFLAKVDALSITGGGDCPEYALSAVSTAIYAGGRGANIFVFTDATAKDSSLQGNIDREAQDQQSKITYLLTGSCSPVDPAYIATAAASGGQIYNLSPSELSNTFDLINAQTLPDSVSLVHTDGTLGATPLALSIPVDAAIQQIVIAVSIEQKQSIALQSPSGALITAATPGVTFTTLSNGWLITIPRPTTGSWALTVRGSGTYSAYVQASSALDLRSVAFVEEQQRRHEGLYPIAGQPLVGTAHTLEARLLGALSAVQFVLVSADGATLAQPILERTPGGGDIARSYRGLITIPDQPFRVVVRGIDATGQPVQRSYPRLFQGQSLAVSIAAPPGVDAFLPGETTPISVTIHNLGAADTFRLEVKDSLGVAFPVEPATVTLPAGASGVIAVDVGIPRLLDTTSEYRLTAVAISTTAPARTNSSLATAIAPAAHVVRLPLVRTMGASSAPYAYRDDFGEHTSGWHQEERSSVSWRYRANEYEMVVRDPESWYAVVGPPRPAGSFSIAADMRLRGGERSAYGLIFGFRSWDDFLVLLVDPGTQSFSVWQKTSGFTAVIPWTKASSIHRGAEPNRLAIEWVDGATVVVRVLINGAQQTAFRIPRRTGGVGFYGTTWASSVVPASFRYDNLRVTPLSPTAAAAPQRHTAWDVAPAGSGRGAQELIPAPDSRAWLRP